MLTIKEASKIINVEPATIRNYVRNGVGKENEKLTAIKVKHGMRSEYRIKSEDLEYYRKKYLC